MTSRGTTVLPEETETALMERRASIIADLQDAFDTERRLLEELRRVLLRQRDGLSGNDLTAIDESVYSAQRVLLTLRQARLRRRTLLQLAGGDADTTLRDLEAVLGGSAPSELVDARDRLLAAAAGLGGELRINRRVIEGALYTGDRLIRAFTGAPEEAPTYQQSTTPDPTGNPGTLINTRV